MRLIPGTHRSVSRKAIDNVVSEILGHVNIQMSEMGKKSRERTGVKEEVLYCTHPNLNPVTLPLNLQSEKGSRHILMVVEITTLAAIKEILSHLICLKLR